MNLKEINYVIFHKNCPDGFGSAWIVNKFLNKEIEYKGIAASTTVKEIELNIKNKNLLILDISFSKEDIKIVEKITKNFLVIDHHLTYFDQISKIKNVELDKSHSAIYLTWKKFFPNKEVPLFVKYVEDNDIKTNKYSETRPFSTALPIKYPFNNQKKFLTWDKLLNNKNVKNLINDGKKYLEYKTHILETNTFYVRKIYNLKNKKFSKYKVILINRTITGLNGDLAEYILKKNHKVDILILWSEIIKNNEEIYTLILRTLKEDINLAELANIYNGGGHAKAAHFFYKKNIKLLFK